MQAAAQALPAAAGVLGYGRFGRALGELLAEAGVAVHAYDPFLRATVTEDAARFVDSPAALCAASAVIFVAVPVPQMNAALRELRDWPMKWIDQMGPSVRLLLGYLLYKADLSPEALDHLAELSDDEEYVKRHPGVYYYLARTQMQSGKPRQAVHNMEQYVKKSPTARGLRR